MDATAVRGVVAAVLLLTGASDDVGPVSERQRVEADIETVVAGIREAVIARNVEALMAYVAADGVPCNDSVIAREKLKRDLMSPGNFLHAYFFDAAEFSEKYRDLAFPKSFAEFLASAKDVRVKVRFTKYPGQAEFAYPCATVSASNLKDRHLFCFSKRHGGWTLADLPNCV